LISEKTFTVYSFISIGLMSLVLALIWLELVDRSLYIPLSIGAAALFAVRMILRIVIARQRRDSARIEAGTRDDLP
jgi:hypothetical protein